MYFVLKKDGCFLYELVCKGIEIECEVCLVIIFVIELFLFIVDSVIFDIICLKGIYICVLGEDIVKVLGIYGYLIYLYCIKIGYFDLILSYIIEYLESLFE